MEWLLIAACLVVAAVIIFAVYKLLKLTLKYAVALLLNALGGIFIVLLANYVFKMGIPYDIPTLLISAICGVPGAICIIILKLIGITL